MSFTFRIKVFKNMSLTNVLRPLVTEQVATHLCTPHKHANLIDVNLHWKTSKLHVLLHRCLDCFFTLLE